MYSIKKHKVKKIDYLLIFDSQILNLDTFCFKDA